MPSNISAIGNPHPARESFDANTRDSQQRFLASYATFGTISHACDATGVSDETVRIWRKCDVQGFTERFNAAQEAYADYLEHLAHERVTVPSNLGRTGSDILLIAMLNAHRPDKYRRDAAPQQQRAPVVQIIINAPGAAQRVVEAQVNEMPALDDGALDATD